ncbi:MAG: insulinase family protein [Prolixibacteraceae bacterium]|nr:insulinase family protein [Burkholderiales bacterium]
MLTRNSLLRSSFVALALIFSAVTAMAATVAQRTLANGMNVIVKEDHRSPVAVSMVWYRAGSMDEVSGTTGVAHMLEHMMFKGTKNVPVGEFSRTVARAGGRENAFTSRDYTAYYQQLHKSKLPLSLELEADRMVNLAFAEDEFAKELNVVKEERRSRTDDQPHSQLHEQLMATVYLSHPYRSPVVGWMNDLQNMQLADARGWYEKWYAPNNATLVVAGDVDPEEVFRLAEKFFGPIPARVLPERKMHIEPRQVGIKRITVKAPAELPYLVMAYHAPVLRDVQSDWEPYALFVLNGVLDGSDASRLNRELVRNTRVANSANSSYDLINRGPAQFFLDAVPAEGKTVTDVETALREQIRMLVEKGVSDDELRRVKAQVTAAQVYARDSVYYQALRIGMLQTIGLPYDSSDLQVKKLQEVTADQVREVARKYLVDDNLTVAVLDPQPLPGGKRPRPSTEGGGRDHR